ncbi:MAG: four helix bundle protein [Desulfobaccales bacterium]
MIKTKSRSFQDLEVWKLSIDLAGKLYKLTNKFPPPENFGLTNRMRRAAVSIPSNIAEGRGRNSAKEIKQFRAISLGSLSELETQLIIAKEIEYLSQEDLDPFLATLDRTRKMIKGLAKGIS